MVDLDWPADYSDGRAGSVAVKALLHRIQAVYNMKKNFRSPVQADDDSSRDAMRKKIIAFRCPLELLSQLDGTCRRYSIDRTAYITIALNHMANFLETGSSSFNGLYAELLAAKKKRKPRRNSKKSSF